MISVDRVVIVGGSVAGATVADRLGRLGYEGETVVVAAERHFPPYDPPPLSKQVLSGEWTEEQARLAVTVSERTRVLTGVSAVGLDRAGSELATSDGSTLRYDRLVVATGSRVRRLATPLPRSGVHVVRTVEDATALRDALASCRRLVIVGSGLIGCEVAATAVQLGIDVVMIGTTTFPMDRFGAAFGAFAADLHCRNGVETRSCVKVVEVLGDERVTGVRLDDGTVVHGDTLLIAIGAEPETRWLAGAELILTDGVVCDDTCTAVGDPNIMVAGDVARWPSARFGRNLRIEHWTNAVEQGAHVARNILADHADRVGYDPVPYAWSTQYDKRIQVIGVLDGAPVVHTEDRAAGTFSALHARGRQLCGAVLVDRPDLVAKVRRAIARRDGVDAVAV
jgi:NADPH-dependent 2,4-dienoyl-CoA reductase/sulfur reductase-like enzyme